MKAILSKKVLVIGLVCLLVLTNVITLVVKFGTGGEQKAKAWTLASGKTATFVMLANGGTFANPYSLRVGCKFNVRGGNDVDASSGTVNLKDGSHYNNVYEQTVLFSDVLTKELNRWYDAAYFAIRNQYINADACTSIRLDYSSSEIEVFYNDPGGSDVDHLNKEIEFAWGDIVYRQGYTFDGWQGNFTGPTFSRGDSYRNGHQYLPRLRDSDSINEGQNSVITARWSVNTYQRSFNLNGGTGSGNYGTVNSQYDSSYTLPVAPQRAGYIFLGWSKNANNANNLCPAGSTQYHNTAGNETWYAQWSSKTYGRYFTQNDPLINSANYDGKNVYNFVSYHAVSMDEVKALPAAPTREGFYFIGWSVDQPAQSANALLSPGTNITQTDTNLIYYANWKENTYKWTYDVTINSPVNDGKQITNIPNPTEAVPYYQERRLASAPVREGYTFIGWQDAGSSLNPIVAGNDFTRQTKSKNVTFKAIWQKEVYTISLKTPIGYFDSGEGQDGYLDGEHQTTIFMNVEYYDNVNLKNYTDKIIAIGEEVKNIVDVNEPRNVFTSVASFRATKAYDLEYVFEPIKYKLIFEEKLTSKQENVGIEPEIPDPVDVTIERAYTIQEKDVPIFPGYTFMGYEVSASAVSERDVRAGGPSLTPGISPLLKVGSVITVDQLHPHDIELLARFAVKHFVVSLDTTVSEELQNLEVGIQNSFGEMDITVEAPATITEADIPQLDGHTFKGFRIGESEDLLGAGDTIELDKASPENIVLTPEFEINEYSLKFVANIPSDITKSKNKTIKKYKVTKLDTAKTVTIVDSYDTTQVVPALKGFVFNGYSMVNSANEVVGTVAKGKPVIKVKEDVTLKPIWKRNTHKISFNGKSYKKNKKLKGVKKLPKIKSLGFNKVFKIAKKKPTKKGYKFLGYKIKTKSSGVLTTKGKAVSRKTILKPGKKYIFGNKNVILVPVWKKA